MKDSDLLRAIALLGLSPDDLRALRGGETAISALREKAKKGYRKAAHRLHPDKTGGDETKAADFRLLADFMAELDRMVPPRDFGYGARRKGTLTVRFTVRVPDAA